MSGIISAEPFNAYFPEILYNETWQGFVTAIYEIGCLSGAIAMLLYGDTLGRRRAIMTGAIIMILGTIIQITPVKGYHAGAQFILGRTITGVGMCLSYSITIEADSKQNRKWHEYKRYTHLSSRVFQNHE